MVIEMLSGELLTERCEPEGRKLRPHILIMRGHCLRSWCVMLIAAEKRRLVLLRDWNTSLGYWRGKMGNENEDTGWHVLRFSIGPGWRELRAPGRSWPGCAVNSQELSPFLSLAAKKSDLCPCSKVSKCIWHHSASMTNFPFQWISF